MDDNKEPQQNKEVFPRGPEFRITGVSEKMKREAFNIADNIGITTSAFLKQKIREIIDSYPEHMKQPIKKD